MESVYAVQSSVQSLLSLLQEKDQNSIARTQLQFSTLFIKVEDKILPPIREKN